MLKNILYVGLGGCIGSVLRYLAGIVIKSPTFPWATLTVNVAGSFAIALVLGAALKSESFDAHWRVLLATGICGGFTTFSAFSAECIILLQQQRTGAFLLYTTLTLLAGLGATYLGLCLMK